MVCIFGGSSEPTIITNSLYITGITKRKDFIYESNSDTFSGFLIRDFIVDKEIKLTNVLIQFNEKDNFKTREIYWTDKKLRLVTWSNTNMAQPPNLNYLDFDVSGAEHNVPYINVNINETIKANNNFALAIICSKTYPSHKPDDVIISISDLPTLTLQENFLPFLYATIKLYYI